MPRSIWLAASLLVLATWLNPWATNGQERYVTWPPAEDFSNQPRYDISMPQFDPRLGPTNELGSAFRPRAEDRPFIMRYRQANQSYQAGLRIVTSGNTRSGQVFPHFNSAKNKYNEFLKHWRLREKQFRNSDTPSAPSGRKKRAIPDDTRKYRWRLRQMAAASWYNMGISSAVLGPTKLQPITRSHDSFSFPRVSHLFNFGYASMLADEAYWSNRKALALYDALRSETGSLYGVKVYTDDPQSPPVANEDDLRFIARAYNNMGAALVRKTMADAFLIMSKKSLPVTWQYGGLSMPTPHFRRWLRQYPFYLDRLYRAAGLFMAALKQEPANALYFQNLFLTLSRRHAALAALGDPRAESCRSFLKKMEKALSDRDARVRLTASIQKSNPCLAFPERPPAVVSPGQKRPPPTGTGQPDRPPATASPGQKRPPTTGTGQPDRPPATASPGQKRPPLKGKGQKVKPPPRCGPGLANQTDCVRKRMEGH